MTKNRPARKPLAWQLGVGLGLVWFAVLFWGNHYRMPADFRRPVMLWSLAGWWVAGLGFLLWKSARAPSVRTRQNRGRTLTAIAGWSLVIALFAGSACAAILLGCNGTFRSNTPFIVDGTVSSKYVNGGRTTTYTIVVREEMPPQLVHLILGRDAYQQVKVGDHYHEAFQVGLFGWPCRP